MARFAWVLVVITVFLAVTHANPAPPSNIRVIQIPDSRDTSVNEYIIDNRRPIHLRCEADGEPLPQYTWKKDGMDINTNGSRITIEDGDLQVRNPTKVDEGMYQCFAHSYLGTALSTKIRAVFAYLRAFQTTEEKNYPFVVGEAATIPCHAPDGAPKPIVYWIDDMLEVQRISFDNRMSQDPEGNMIISDIIAEDDGNYYCFAGNQILGIYGRSPKISITVDTKSRPADLRPPTIAFIPKSPLQVLRTKKMKLKCLATGYPTPVITWSKSTGNLPAGRHSLDPYGQELTIENIEFDDAGTYVCSATNSQVASPVTSTVLVNVQSAPYFIDPIPTDANIAPGEDLTVLCNVGGLPAATVQWYQNGAVPRDSETQRYEITGPAQNSASISLQNAEIRDSTVFQCVANNDHGEILQSVTITVVAIPATLQIRLSGAKNVAEGDDLSLNCQAFGSPKPTITWYYNDTEVERGVGISIEETGTEIIDSVLTYTNIKRSLKGIFNCTTSNSQGRDSSKTVLSVRRSTLVRVRPYEQDVVRGSTANVKCEVIESDSSVNPTIQWNFNGNPIKLNVPGGRYSFNGKTLKVMEATLDDSGNYTCNATTYYDFSTGTSKLTVKSEPSPPYGISVSYTEGELTAELSWIPGADNNAEITSYIIEYKTQYNNFPMDFPNYNPSKNPWIVMKEIPASSSSDTLELDNNIQYRLRVLAVNDVGSSQPSDITSAIVTPAAPPAVLPKNVRSDNSEAGKLTIEWDAVHPHYHNGPDFKYVITYKAEGSDEEIVETISPPATSFTIQAGIYEGIEYSVGVQNAEDSGPEPIRGNATTGQDFPSSAPSGVKVEAISESEVNVTWTPVPKEDVNGKLQTYRVYYSMMLAQGSEEHLDCSLEVSCVVGNLQPFTRYDISVALVNGAGEGPRSNPVSVTTEEGVPSEVKINDFAASSSRLSVKWERPLQDNGKLLGYHLFFVKYDDDDNLSPASNYTVDDPETLECKVEADPNSKYEVSVSAFTSKGDGIVGKKSASTGKPLKPVASGAPQLGDPGVSRDQFNLTSEHDEKNGGRPDFVTIYYRPKGDPDADWQNTGKADALDDDYIIVDDLEDGTEYEVYYILENEWGSVQSETTVIKTTGTGPSVGSGFLEAWFIAIICIVILLLLILLIICILRTQKGGKYNVSDKEKQLKDPENVPLKGNEGFNEYNPDSEFPDEPNGSQDSLASNPEGSEGDSLKEYADDEDPSKFNEEGSFIEEYHDPQTRPSETKEGGISTFV